MDLRGYLDSLTIADQLARVEFRVQCDLELAAICRQEFQKPDGGKALLFTNLAESEYALAANLFGSEQRLLSMLRCDSLQQFAAKISQLLRQTVATSVLKQASVKAEPLALEQTTLRLSTLSDVLSIPSIRTWPGEVGRYLNLALTVTRDLETGEQNVGLYRAQLLTDRQIAINFARGSGADQHLQAAQRVNQPLPIALVLGGDPAYLWAAAAPLPATCDEFSFCTAAFGSDRHFVSCVSQNLLVPANAELVIEGQIEAGASCVEGPFGNHTGQYVTREDCPLMSVTQILQKPEPIIPMTTVGPPPSENVYLGKANEILIREMLKFDYPQILNLRMPVETIFHAASLLTVAPQSGKANRELIDNLWNNSPLSRAKLLILLDADIDIESFSQCWWRTINKLDTAKIYQDKGRLAIDATGIDPAQLVVENQQTIDFLNQLNYENNL